MISIVENFACDPPRSRRCRKVRLRSLPWTFPPRPMGHSSKLITVQSFHGFNLWPRNSTARPPRRSRRYSGAPFGVRLKTHPEVRQIMLNRVSTYAVDIRNKEAYPLAPWLALPLAHSFTPTGNTMERTHYFGRPATTAVRIIAWLRSRRYQTTWVIEDFATTPATKLGVDDAPCEKRRPSSPRADMEAKVNPLW